MTKLVNGKVAGCLNEALLDEDIGGFVGMYLFNAVDDIKNNTEIMGDFLATLKTVKLVLLFFSPTGTNGMQGRIRSHVGIISFPFQSRKLRDLG